MIFKPTIESVPLADGLRWRAGNGWRYEEKLDGCWHVEELPHATTVVGELMRGGQFFAFDVLRYKGQDLRPLALCERLTVLDGMKLPRPTTGSGGAFLAAVLERGGEGVVAKPLNSPYGVGWLKCKRSQVFYCRVTDLDPMRGSAILADSVTGEKRGKLPLRGGKFELVRVGSILKVEAYGLTAKGLLREARPDHDEPDSWLVSV
jgi:ATP-dependent DNA ligase